MSSIRRASDKYGFCVNGEQQVATDVGTFGASAGTTGQNEILSFTDIDRSVSAGVSIKGSHWGRANDTIGLWRRDQRPVRCASRLPRRWRQRIADRRRTARITAPSILETYYACAIDKNFTLTADYQLIANPAYNKDRGPVSIFSGRLHGEF